MRPTQTPTALPPNGPTPLQSSEIPNENLGALTITRQSMPEATAAIQLGSAQSQRFPNGMDQRPEANRAAITLNTPSENNNSIGFTVDQLREFMNQRSANPMTAGRVLANEEARWDVLNSKTVSGHSTAAASAQLESAPNDSSGIQIIPGVAQKNRSETNTGQSNPFGQISASRDLPVTETVLQRMQTSDSEFPTDGLLATEVSLEQPFPTAAGVKSNTAPLESVATGNPPSTQRAAEVEDDSMLTRLKGLYDPSEDGVARRIWKAQIPKLPNPWSVFRDREQPTAPVATEPDLFVEAENPNQPLSTAAQIPADQEVLTPGSGSLLSQLVSEYETRIANWPKTPAERIEDPEEFRKLQQELRLLYLLQDRPEEAVTAIDMLSPAEQQFWQSLVMSLAEYRMAQASESPSTHYTGSVHQLRAALQALSPLADLRIRRLEICSRIHSYGRIETFPSNDFDPGRPLLLYVELENFGTQTTASGRYLASFDATLQIIEKGKEVVKETIRLTDITDEATSARTDYFQSYDLTLPSHLMAGEYEIRLKIRDKFTGKTTQKVVGFQVR